MLAILTSLLQTGVLSGLSWSIFTVHVSNFFFQFCQEADFPISKLHIICLTHYVVPSERRFSLSVNQFLLEKKGS